MEARPTKGYADVKVQEVDGLDKENRGERGRRVGRRALSPRVPADGWATRQMGSFCGVLSSPNIIGSDFEACLKRK
ncbi:MAG: hypothetical protein WBB67_07125 [bacterium]